MWTTKQASTSHRGNSRVDFTVCANSLCQPMQASGAPRGVERHDGKVRGPRQRSRRAQRVVAQSAWGKGVQPAACHGAPGPRQATLELGGAAMGNLSQQIEVPQHRALSGGQRPGASN